MKRNTWFIYKMMARYIFEIVLVLAFMLISYEGFTKNNLSEASQIASLSESETREIQAIYNYGSREDIVTLNEQDLLNRGTLALKNPNRKAKEIGVVIQIRKNDKYQIGDLNILVNGEEANMGVIMNLDETYEVNLGTLELDAYESENLDIAIYSRVGIVPVEYSFKLVGSF